MALEFPKQCYGQRWQVESCFSQDKRRFGSALRARSQQTQYGELYLRVLIHNIAIIWRVHLKPRLMALIHLSLFNTAGRTPLVALLRAFLQPSWYFGLMNSQIICRCSGNVIRS